MAGGPALPLHYVVEQLGEGGLVTPGEKCFPRRAQPVSERRRTDALMQALVFDQAFGLELLEVMPYGVEGDAEPGGQLLGRQPVDRFSSTRIDLELP